MSGEPIADLLAAKLPRLFRRSRLEVSVVFVLLLLVVVVVVVVILPGFLCFAALVQLIFGGSWAQEPTTRGRPSLSQFLVIALSLVILFGWPDQKQQGEICFVKLKNMHQERAPECSSVECRTAALEPSPFPHGMFFLFPFSPLFSHSFNVIRRELCIMTTSNAAFHSNSTLWALGPLLVQWQATQPFQYRQDERCKARVHFFTLASRIRLTNADIIILSLLPNPIPAPLRGQALTFNTDLKNSRCNQSNRDQPWLPSNAFCLPWTMWWSM